MVGNIWNLQEIIDDGFEKYEDEFDSDNKKYRSGHRFKRTIDMDNALESYTNTYYIHQLFFSSDSQTLEGQ